MGKETITDSEFNTLSQGSMLPRMRRNLRTLPESVDVGEWANEYEYETSEPVDTPRIDTAVSEHIDEPTIQDQDSTNGNACSRGNLVHEIGRAVRDDMHAILTDSTERGKHNMTESMLIELAAKRGAAMVLDRIGLGMLKNKGEI